MCPMGYQSYEALTDSSVPKGTGCHNIGVATVGILAGLFHLCCPSIPMIFLVH